MKLSVYVTDAAVIKRLPLRVVDVSEGVFIPPPAFSRYIAAGDFEAAEAVYIDAMRRSYAANPARWHWVMGQGLLVLYCLCAKEDACHRDILAQNLFPRLAQKLGAEYHYGGWLNVAVKRQ